ncbi:sulfur carrier protein ThiS [Epibacterium ulvae]|uniref:sulfur carrier protein ThiS n=1 Tax=Epibacterium ulvae TaxID=1156985 RepID=UPI0024900D96|nr:sulfur carrier protein ThiS [Epibacterium ulvae]
MKISVNGDPHEVTSERLSAVLDELGYGAAKVATAINEAFVPAGQRTTTPVREGDRLEIVAPRQGG